MEEKMERMLRWMAGYRRCMGDTGDRLDSIVNSVLGEADELGEEDLELVQAAVKNPELPDDGK